MKAADIEVGKVYAIAADGRGSKVKARVTAVRDHRSRGQWGQESTVKRVHFERITTDPDNVVGRYGRTYCTLAQVLAPWTDDDDAQIRAAEEAREERIQIRDRLRAALGITDVREWRGVYVSATSVRFDLSREQADALLRRLEG